MSHPHHAHTDPRDHLISAEEVNATPHYVMYSVFRTAGPLRDLDATAAEEAVLDSGVSIRGTADQSALMVCRRILSRSTALN